MNDEPLYIETPRSAARPERIDAILQKRLKDFLLARQQRMWREGEL
ncbi:MAG: hypothetical protein WAQ25_04740 [Candidatus Saccharimonas sp.]